MGFQCIWPCYSMKQTGGQVGNSHQGVPPGLSRERNFCCSRASCSFAFLVALMEWSTWIMVSQFRSFKPSCATTKSCSLWSGSAPAQVLEKSAIPISRVLSKGTILFLGGEKQHGAAGTQWICARPSRPLLSPAEPIGGHRAEKLTGTLFAKMFSSRAFFL